MTTTAVAVMALARASSPSDCSHAESRGEKAASPTMPFRSPITVMPIWMVERKRVGSRLNLTAAAASVSPWLASAVSRGMRAVSSATSDMANAPLMMIKPASIRISMVALRSAKASGSKRSAPRSAAAEQDLDYEFRAKVRENERDETGERPAHRHAAPPAIDMAAGEQRREDDPRDDAEYGLVIELCRLAEQFLRKDDAAHQRQRQQNESRPDHPEQQRLHGEQRRQALQPLGQRATVQPPLEQRHQDDMQRSDGEEAVRQHRDQQMKLEVQKFRVRQRLD